MPGLHPTRQALDVEVLDRDPAEAVDDSPRELVQVIAPLVGDVFLILGLENFDLGSPLRTLLASGEGAQSLAQALCGLRGETGPRCFSPLESAIGDVRPTSMPTVMELAVAVASTSTWKTTYHLRHWRVRIADAGLLGGRGASDLDLAGYVNDADGTRTSITRREASLIGNRRRRTRAPRKKHAKPRRGLNGEGIWQDCRRDPSRPCLESVLGCECSIAPGIGSALPARASLCEKGQPARQRTNLNLVSEGA